MVDNFGDNWASEGSPHWAVQSRLRVICRYVCMSVCLQKNTYVKMCGWNYVAQTRTCSKSVLGS